MTIGMMYKRYVMPIMTGGSIHAFLKMYSLSWKHCDCIVAHRAAQLENLWFPDFGDISSSTPPYQSTDVRLLLWG